MKNKKEAQCVNNVHLHSYTYAKQRYTGSAALICSPRKSVDVFWGETKHKGCLVCHLESAVNGSAPRCYYFGLALKTTNRATVLSYSIEISCRTIKLITIK